MAQFEIEPLPGFQVYNLLVSMGLEVAMEDSFRVGRWRVEPSLNTICRNGTSVHLEPKVMQVLVCLAEHADEAVPKDTLLQTVWPGTFVTDDALKHSIFELRQVFEDDAREPRFIQTIPKRGYRLVAAVERANGKPAATVPAKPMLGRPKRLAVATLLIVLGAAGVNGLRNWQKMGVVEKSIGGTETSLIQNIPPEVVPKRVIRAVLPAYPRSAMQAQVTGTVEIGLGISPRGDVANAHVLTGHPLLVTAALEAIRQWQFQPNVFQGKLTGSRMRALVRFSADGTTAVAFARPLLADSFGDPGAERDPLQEGATPPVVSGSR